MGCEECRPETPDLRESSRENRTPATYELCLGQLYTVRTALHVLRTNNLISTQDPYLSICTGYKHTTCTGNSCYAEVSFNTIMY